MPDQYAVFINKKTIDDYGINPSSIKRLDDLQFIKDVVVLGNFYIEFRMGGKSDETDSYKEFLMDEDLKNNDDYKRLCDDPGYEKITVTDEMAPVAIPILR